MELTAINAPLILTHAIEVLQYGGSASRRSKARESKNWLDASGASFETNAFWSIRRNLRSRHLFLGANDAIIAYDDRTTARTKTIYELN